MSVPNLTPGAVNGASGVFQAPMPFPATPNLPASRIAGPLLTKSEFQLLAEDAAGRPLPVYGRDLFGEIPTTFAPVDSIPVPADYVLGPGDQLLIRVWGKIDLQTVVSVDRNGQIFLPRIGTFAVAGLRYQQIESYLRSAIGNLYKGFELNVTMGQLRSIQIFVLGSARQPGVYTVSSLSTLVDALFTSGGPSATGSMRRIQLRRGNQVITQFDLYDLLRNGDKSHDVQLLSGDVIFIPPMGPEIAISGSVNEPGIYELKGDATIASALKAASGIASLAGTDRVLLERTENHRRRRVDDFALDAAGMERALHDGDILEIFPISPKFENAVTLRGNVAQPGRYPWREGMRISDLIPSRDVLITRNYWIRQNHLTPTADPGPGTIPQLNPYATQSAAILANQEEILNPGRRPSDGLQQQNDPYGAAQLTPANTTAAQPSPTDTAPPDMLSDIAQNNSEINWDYAAIERLDEHDLSTRLVAFNLGKAIDNPSSAENQVLKPGDVVTIFARHDLPLPIDKHAMFVRVSGEVNAPGVYRVRPGETLRQVVERAGGLTPHSYLYASQLTRVSTRLSEEQELRQSAQEMQKELVARYAGASSLTSVNAAEQRALMASQQEMVAQLATVHPTGRIVLDMNPSAGSIADIPALPLEDGDSYYIPPRLSTVQVAGAVYNPNAFRYEPRKRLEAYLRDAGGPNRGADSRRIFLIRADGTVVSRQNHGQFWRADFEKSTLLPGDSIIVPAKLKSPAGFAQQLPFITQILSQSALTGAAIAAAF